MIHIYSLIMILAIIVLMALGLHTVAIALFATNMTTAIILMIINYYLKLRNRK